MRKRLSKLPSPAMTVAFVALLAALTGTAVALPGTNTVTKNDLVNGAVGKAELGASSAGRSEIRSGAVTGSEAVESTFGTVPRATQADAADTAGRANTAGAAGVANFAGNAGAVDGSSIANINFRAAEEAANTVILDQGGLRLVANCIADDIELNAINTTSAIGSLYVDGIGADVNPGDPDPVDPDVSEYEQFDQFEPGELNQIGIEFYPNDTDTNQTLYFSAAGGRNVTAHIHYEEDAQVSPGQTGCAVTGYAVVS